MSVADAARKRAKRATPEGKAYEREQKRRYRATVNGRKVSGEATRRYRQGRGSGSYLRPFVGIDGEGGNIGTRHEYLLLRAGSQTLYTGKPLTPYECLDFIAALPSRVVYVGYFFDYDVTMILRDLPADRVRRLLDREARTGADGKFTFPVDWEGFQFDYLPHKEFRVRRFLGLKPDKSRHYSAWVVINDVGSFFQCAFVKALAEWEVGTPEELAAIAAGKDARAEFGELDEETDRYNALEIDLLERLMGRFRDTCERVGYVPARWQGPGNLAVSMMQRHGVPKTRMLTIPTDVVQMADDAYYGGRFETTRVGPVGSVFQYDICSAYPAAMLELPCLLHARWVQERRGEWQLLRGHFAPTEDALLYSFPIRSPQGTVYYPAEGNGTYWSREVGSARHQSFDVEDAWSLISECDCDVFDWIEPVYQQRLALGKSRQGRPLKLGLNSLYGKQCQSVGSAPYANPIYAGLITAITRAKLNDAAHGHPEFCCQDCVMLATDAVFTREPRPGLELGKELGQWEAEGLSELFIIQPGLYFTDKHDQPKTRGIPRQRVVEHRADFLSAFADLLVSGDCVRSSVSVPLRQFIGLRIANARGRLDTAGLWAEVTKTVSFDWQTKRDPQRTAIVGRGPGRMSLATWPKSGGPGLWTTPYSKDIGKMLELGRLLEADQPDWADLMFGDEL